MKRPILSAAFLTLAVLSVLDVLTTSEVLAAGGVEANPGARFIVERGVPAMLAVKAGLLALLAVLPMPWRSYLTRGMVVITALAVVANSHALAA
ncbi:MAG: DUF5658 family protein [Actinomycetota bacterium]|nr:DUF5658 family protein [Actinomycetota bacterium]